MSNTSPRASRSERTAPESEETQKPFVPVVFVVDDDEAVRSALRILILSMGWDVRTYGRGTALLADGLPPQNACVLVDLNMPEMNGVEVVEELRRRGSKLPVIGFTAERDSPLIPRLRAAGAKTVLFKPIHDEALRAAVAGALKAAEA